MPKRSRATSEPARRSKRARSSVYDSHSDGLSDVEDARDAGTSVDGAAGSTSAAWQTNADGTLLWFNDTRVFAAPASKIASFDLNETLSSTASGKKFPVNAADIKPWHSSVPKKLRELHHQGVKLVIFTNQAGLDKTGLSTSAWKAQIATFLRQVGAPMQVFAALGKDNRMRKPDIGMWDAWVRLGNAGTTPLLQDCVYVGDAAGRHARWDGGAKTKKDFACSDRMFASNVGLPFQTPEQYFLGQPETTNWDWGALGSPSDILATAPASSDTLVTKRPDQQHELVMMIGWPGSGKSTFVRRHFVPLGYEHVNRDTLKTQDKCLRAVKAALAAGRSVVVDNTNPSAASRAEYIKLAKQEGVPVRGFVMEAERPLAEHLNRLRAVVGEAPRIPTIAYNMYKSKFNHVSADEGFESVQTVPFVPDFASQQHRDVFLMHL